MPNGFAPEVISNAENERSELTAGGGGLFGHLFGDQFLL